MSRAGAQWATAIGHVQAARVARDCQRNPEATRQMKDQAVLDYVRAVDGMFAALDALMAQGVTGRIATFLNSRERW